MNSVIYDLNLCIHWGELLHILSSNLRTRLEQMSVIHGGLNKDTNLSQEVPGDRFSKYHPKVPLLVRSISAKYEYSSKECRSR